MSEQTRAPAFIMDSPENFVEGGNNSFFPSANLQAIEAGPEPAACGMTNSSDQSHSFKMQMHLRYIGENRLLSLLEAAER